MSAKIPAAPRGFVTTRWSVVDAAGENTTSESRAALEKICETYWPALYGYVRRRGYNIEDAHDLTQEFFLRLLDRSWIAQADKAKGRFRSFLLTVLKHFLADEWDKTKTIKRGGHVELQSLSDMAEAAYAMDTSRTELPDLDFERDWAITLLNNVLSGLEDEYTRGGKSLLFAALKPSLGGVTGHQPYAVVAAELGMSESTFKVAVCRIRQRYRERMRNEVSATVTDARDVDSELRHLCRILAKTY